MKEFTKYYFITVFQSYDDYGPRGMRCWGFYDNWYEANNTLSNNITDLWETCYNYGVIEEYEAGIGGYTGIRQFYKYNIKTGFYDNIEEPKELKHYWGFSLG